MLRTLFEVVNLGHGITAAARGRRSREGRCN
jgi:hypothetical protein